jgi:ectoine hydroxylase-related dioxygenase (phytanoyl-CoA dioxygenase family)
MGIDTGPLQPDGQVEHWVQALLAEGYCIIPAVVPPDLIAGLASDLEGDFARTPCASGPFYGSSTKRFHGLLRRSVHMDAFVRHPLVCAIVQTVLGAACDTIQLNLTQAIEILPGAQIQPPHRDQDMWPIRAPGIEYLVNVMWPFSPYTKENGATRLWPGSHRRQDEMLLDPADAVSACMAPGEALLFLGSTLHGGGANETQDPRRGMIVSYSLGWLKPYELPWLAYPPDVARAFSPELSALAGYRAHRPNLGTYEGRCPSVLLSDVDATALGAVDALRPEHEALIARFHEGSLPVGFNSTAAT